MLFQTALVPEDAAHIILVLHKACHNGISAHRLSKQNFRGEQVDKRRDTKNKIKGCPRRFRAQLLTDVLASYWPQELCLLMVYYGVCNIIPKISSSSH